RFRRLWSHWTADGSPPTSSSATPAPCRAGSSPRRWTSWSRGRSDRGSPGCGTRPAWPCCGARPARGGPPPGGRSLRARSASPGRIVLEVPAGGETLLATSIPWSQGWSARADGRDLPTLTVNGAFLGVSLPEAVSRVELRFLPPGFVAGCAAFAVSFLAALALALSRSSGPARAAGGPESGGRDRPRAAPEP
ncbi:hypothetical protein EHM82_07315, partial [bacterium]